MRFGESHKSLIFSYISQLCIFLYLSVIHIAHTYLSEIRPVHRLEGLLYFTDGLGIYPTRPVTYKTAFVFTEPELELQKDFPSWAMKLILTEDEIDTL